MSSSNNNNDNSKDKREKDEEEYVVPEVWEPPESQGGTWGSGVNRPTSGARFQRDLPIGNHSIQLYSLGTVWVHPTDKK